MLTYSRIDKRIKQFIIFIKLWFKQKFKGAKCGDLNSYSVVIMCLYFFQTRKKPIVPIIDLKRSCEIKEMREELYKQETKLKVNFTTENTDNLFELIKQFFYFYSSFR